MFSSKEAVAPNARPLGLRSRPLLALIFLLAFVLRAAPNIWLEWNEPGWHASHLNEIEFYYDDVARSLIAGKGFVHSVNPRSPDSEFGFRPGTPFHFVPPLYAWVVGVEYLVFGPNVFVAKLIQCVLDSLTCLFIYTIGVRMVNRRTALIAAALYAVYPLAIVTNTRLYYQTPLNLALCWIVLRMAAPVTAANGMWTGIAIGVSALAKPVTLPLIALAPVVKMFETVRHRASIRSLVRWSIALVAGCVLTLAPWTIRNYVVFDRFIPVQSGAGAVLIQGSKEAYVDLDVGSLRRQYGQTFGVTPDNFASTALANHRAHLTSDPLDYFRFLAKKFALAWYNTEGKEKNRTALLVQLPFIGTAILGLIMLFPLWTRTPNWYVIGLILYITALQIPLFPLVRYTLAVMPLVMLPAASAIDRLLYRWNVTQKS
jgi:4-amino-4-deoxy-L-arabinose transferase-like glycosyltransferase